MNTGIINAIAVLVGALLGSGGVTAVIHALVERRKAKNEGLQEDHNFENEKASMLNDVQKYMNEEMKKLNERISEQLEEVKEENAELKKEIKELNKKLADLIHWVMYDNAAHRAWLEKTLREFDPNIDIPECSEPPIVFTDFSETHEEETKDSDDEITD
jgi:DNA repair exonuclease SbcCD ATPase subunit